MNSTLIVFRSSPHTSAAGQEGLDSVLAALAMDLKVSLLFLDEGVFLLTKKGHSPASELRDYTKGFAALSDLGVEKILVDASSLGSRGVCIDELLVEATAVPESELNALFSQYDRVIIF